MLQPPEEGAGHCSGKPPVTGGSWLCPGPGLPGRMPTSVTKPEGLGRSLVCVCHANRGLCSHSHWRLLYFGRRFHTWELEDLDAGPAAATDYVALGKSLWAPQFCRGFSRLGHMLQVRLCAGVEAALRSAGGGSDTQDELFSRQQGAHGPLLCTGTTHQSTRCPRLACLEVSDLTYSTPSSAGQRPQVSRSPS